MVWMLTDETQSPRCWSSLYNTNQKFQAEERPLTFPVKYAPQLYTHSPCTLQKSKLAHMCLTTLELYLPSSMFLRRDEHLFIELTIPKSLIVEWLLWGAKQLAH